MKVKAGIIGNQDHSQQDDSKNDVLAGKADDDAMKTKIKKYDYYSKGSNAINTKELKE